MRGLSQVIRRMWQAIFLGGWVSCFGWCHIMSPWWWVTGSVRLCGFEAKKIGVFRLISGCFAGQTYRGASGPHGNYLFSDNVTDNVAEGLVLSTNYEVLHLVASGWGFGTICFWQTTLWGLAPSGGWLDLAMFVIGRSCDELWGVKWPLQERWCPDCGTDMHVGTVELGNTS